MNISWNLIANTAHIIKTFLWFTQANTTIETPTVQQAPTTAQKTTTEHNTTTWFSIGTISVLDAAILTALVILCYSYYKIISRLTSSNDPQAPKTFNNSLNFNIWLNQVDQYLDDLNIKSDNSRMDIVLSKLDASSRQTIKELIKNKVVKTYKDLKDHLHTVHSNNTQSHADHIINLLDRRQRPNESLHQYYTAICDLARLAYPNETDETINKHASTQFIAGLYNTLIKGQLLINRNPKQNVLSQAVQLQSKLGDAATELNMPIAANHIKSYRHRRISFDDTTQRNNNDNIQHQQAPHDNNEQQQQQQKHHNSRYQRTEDNFHQITCYNCGRRGHTARTCQQQPQRSSNNERSQHATNSRPPTPQY